MKINSATTAVAKPQRASRPKAIGRYRGLFIACCLMEGMNLLQAEKEFESANRRLWASAL